MILVMTVVLELNRLMECMSGKSIIIIVIEVRTC